MPWNKEGYWEFESNIRQQEEEINRRTLGRQLQLVNDVLT
jgi:hypothetical protein